MFKLPDPEAQKQLLEAYRVLGTEQQKVVNYLALPFLTNGNWTDLSHSPKTRTENHISCGMLFNLIPTW